jgi:hypothetical protein
VLLLATGLDSTDLLFSGHLDTEVAEKMLITYVYVYRPEAILIGVISLGETMQLAWPKISAWLALELALPFT